MARQEGGDFQSSPARCHSREVGELPAGVCVTPLLPAGWNGLQDVSNPKS